jgi:endonuclease G
MSIQVFQRKLAGVGLALVSFLALACPPRPAGNDGPGEPTRQLEPASHGHRGHGKKHEPAEAPEAPSAASPPSTKPTTAPAPSSVHLAMGTPGGPESADDYLVVKPQYVVGYSHRRNTPSWVSWNLNASYFGSAPRRKGKFLADDSLPDGWYRVQDHDYAGSGYDRGHMVRSEERTRSPEDNESTFYLTNVLPQTHDLNAGPWLRLEDYCQELAQKENKELYLVAGGIFAASPPTIGHGVAVPDSCFKIVVVLDKGQSLGDVTASTRVIAVVMPNVKGILDEAWGQYRTSVAEVEKKSGHTFLTAVPEAVRKTLETRVDTGPTSGSR